MALSTVITGFITTEQLRSVIGKPTADTADPGFVSDAELERIIQRHHDEAVEHARKMAHQLVEAGEKPVEKRVFVPVAIALSASSTQPGLREGTISDTYYPYVEQVMDGDGNAYVYDDQIARTVLTSFTRRFVYKTMGRKILVSPGMDGNSHPEIINVHLATENNVWDFLFDGEMVRKYNEAIIQEAVTLMDRTIQEGLRLETIYTSNDNVPGDNS